MDCSAYVPEGSPTPTSHYASINGLHLYYEVYGSGEPLVLLHGGLRCAALLQEFANHLLAHRQVIVVDLQGHGKTADIERPLRYESLAEDIAALIGHLNLSQVDVLGYSFGGGTALRLAVQHPEKVRKLIIASTACIQSGWYPEVVAGFHQINGAIAEHMKPSREYQIYAANAPNPDGFPKLLDKMGELLRRPYDWSEEMKAISAQALLIFGDNDSVQLSHIVRFFELLGGGQKDAGWDGSGMSKSRLAILPGRTHYNLFDAPLLLEVVKNFLEP